VEKEKWRILPVGEVHDQPAAPAGGHRRNTAWARVSGTGRELRSISWLPQRADPPAHPCREDRPALSEIRDDFHRIVYAASADAARAAFASFERTWSKRCPGVVASLREGGEELLTFLTFPKAQWKTLRTTNTIERLH
jgi:hypothetical protein